MIPPRPRPRALLLWLAALLVAGLGLLAPGAASAHAGHGAHGGERAAPPSAQAQAAVVDPHEAEARPEAIAGPAGEAAAVPCGGAACCATGHGCCAAITVAAPATPSLPAAAPPGAGPPGLPPGIAVAALPEPPRPFR